MKFLFGKNYPLWLILLLVAVIVGGVYLHLRYVDNVKTTLVNKGIVLIEGDTMMCLPFETIPTLPHHP